MALRRVAMAPAGPGQTSEGIRVSGPGAVVLLPRNGREAPQGVRDSRAPMTKRRIKAWELTCERCGHVALRAKEADIPDRCPSCKSRNWLEPARWKRPDRRRAPVKKR